jgi:hypothetical protein
MPALPGSTNEDRRQSRSIGCRFRSCRVPKLLTAYYEDRPDPHIPAQRIVFGTSGHRGSFFDRAFNEWHILAITQAICLYRQRQKIDGPLFLGIDTHALSRPALASALEVLAANGVDVMLAEKDDYTPTPAVSHAIFGYNRGRATGLADGIVITPSHNPRNAADSNTTLLAGAPLTRKSLHGSKRWPMTFSRRISLTSSACRSIMRIPGDGDQRSEVMAITIPK